MARRNKNKTNDNNNNNDKNDENNATKTTTNDEDRKKREERRRRFNAPALLESEDAGLDNLFEEALPSAASSSTATRRRPSPTQQEEETAMEEDDDSDFGIGSLFDKNVPTNDDVLDSDEQEVADNSTPRQRDSRPKRRTLRCYIIAEQGEVEYGARRDWAPSKTSAGVAPLTTRDVGCQTRCGNDSLARRREMLRRHRSNKRARQAAKNVSTTSTTASEREAPAGGAITHPQKRPRQNSTQQEDLRTKLKQRRQDHQPQKRVRIDSPLPKSSFKEAQRARDFYKARHEGSSRGHKKKPSPSPHRPPPPPPSRKRSRPSSPQPSTSTGISNQPPKSFMEKMKDSCVHAGV